ncbi:mechanosensitive ion channel [Porticoccaceae bacterium]|jgi:small-conductance mechanosensitive channel|nr:mechanosensitive ion channel [Porticoccaceae bacterium]MDA9232167.1 mechanosensitive ion channel [Porticoccaceae bacterium]MDA9346084.1 mechanosensitive ion channel [Porticoccaceae bacterium]MDB4109549.1 mechanosensitive ion channel [Porticoccaceae bacterium]MDC0134362.1 mechanosensitive ion channel [Porticoccaceae bacterium]|tara:strand:- start:153 stop:1019 length:867 start_codon:yes stop_codon:yes gene_type:complete
MIDIQKFSAIRIFTLGGYDVTAGQLVFIPLVIICGYLLLNWLVRRITKQMHHRGMDVNLVQVVRRAIYIVGLVVLCISLLEMLNVPLSAFAFISGAVAIGIGFGAQNIINNFISGWILIWERPISINDFIETGGVSGTVEEINTRSTKIRRVDGVHLLVPNSKLIEETVTNWTLEDKLFRCTVRVGVAYGSDVDKVRSLLEKAVVDHALILSEPPPQIIFEDFGDSSLVFDAYFWVYSVGDKSAREIRSEIRFTVNRLFANNGIAIAFPQTDIHVDGTLRLQVPGAAS